MELILGDCFYELDNMKDKCVDFVLTDPPYDLSYSERCLLHAKLLRVCKGAIAVFCPPENRWQPTCDQYLFWIKPISTKNTSKSYSRFVEMIQVWNGNVWNDNRHWSQYTNVFTDLVDDKSHAHVKPLSMLIRLIRNHTNEGDIVLDSFMGSGMTGVACKRTNRGFIGIEKDEEIYRLASEGINQ